MAHKGKFYPILNPGRILTPYDWFPFGLPTEFTLTCYSGWLGPAASTLPDISGRGLSPFLYTAGERHIIYAVQVPSTGENPFQLVVGFELDAGGSSMHMNVIQIDGAVLVWQWTGTFGVDFLSGFRINIPGLTGTPLLNPSATRWGTLFDIIAVKWSASPPPVLSYPF